MERNGKVNKTRTELLSWHKVLLCTDGSLSYTHANCSCTRREAGGQVCNCSLIQLETDEKQQTTSNQRILDATAQYDCDDDNAVVNKTRNGTEWKSLIKQQNC